MKWKGRIIKLGACKVHELKVHELNIGPIDYGKSNWSWEVDTNRVGKNKPKPFAKYFNWQFTVIQMSPEINISVSINNRISILWYIEKVF